MGKCTSTPLLLFVLCHCTADAFVQPTRIGNTLRSRGAATSNLAAASNFDAAAANELLQIVDGDDETPTTEKVAPLVETLEQSYAVGTSTSANEHELFAPLLGLYSVAAVLPAKPGENPVGGKWTRKSGLAQKLLNTRATYQHLLPANSTGSTQPQSSNSYTNGVIAEAVNVISLEALFGLIRLNVILRGDATPLSLEEREVCEDIAKHKAKDKGVENKVGRLSPLTVRAKFDPPRIVFGRRGRCLNLNLGPRSSVVLDTTYCDNSIRIGKGGTSGTRFIFRRIPPSSDTDVEKADEWRPLLSRRPLRKSKALVILGSMLGGGIRSTVKGQARVLGISISTISALLGAVVIFSSGGIEDDDD